MIRDYELRNEKNEQILYLYLDFNTEFAKLNAKKKKKKLKSIINDFIKENNIDFKGTKVALVVGGALVGTILFKPLEHEDYNFVNNNTNYVVKLLDEKNIEDNIINNNIDNINEEIPKDESEKVNNTDSTKEELSSNKVSNINNNNSSKNESQEINNNSTNSTNLSEENNNINKTDSSEVEQNNNQEVNETSQTYVTIYRTNGSVLNLELEEYLIGVVGAEMPASFNSEALKAQAVVARTYTLKSIKTGKKLTDSSSTQNYKSNDELKSMWGSSYSTYYNKVKNAVNATKGAYLTYNGTIIEAVYHSTSNGYTEDAKNVWGNSFPYLVTTSSEYDSTNKSFIYTVSFTYEQVSNKLGYIVNNDTVFNIVEKNESNRVSTIMVNENKYSGVEFRNLLGLRSTDFEIVKNDSGLVITTKGYGHGVGMSQYGANGMANNGYSYKDILLHYYKGVTISYN